VSKRSRHSRFLSDGLESTFTHFSTWAQRGVQNWRPFLTIRGRSRCSRIRGSWAIGLIWNITIFSFFETTRAPSRAFDTHAILCVTNVSFHCVLSPIFRQELNHEIREIHERSPYRTVFRVFRVFRGSLVPMSVGCPGCGLSGFVVERSFSCSPTKKGPRVPIHRDSRARLDTCFVQAL
jgi:hypothetical protein